MPEEQQELVVLQGELSKWNSLLQAKGWTAFQELGQDKVDQILSGLCQTESAELTMDSIPGLLWCLGEIQAIKRLMDFPTVQVAVLKAEIEKLKGEENDERDDGTREPGDERAP